MPRPPSINLRLDVALVAQMREAAGPGELTAAINQAMQMWLAAKRAPQPAPAPAAPAPAPAAPSTVPTLEPPRLSTLQLLPPVTVALERPSNMFIPPGSSSTQR
jgi:hypothetical protein